MARFAIQLFGRFAVHDDSGTEIRVPPGKVRALLAYMAVRPGQAYSRAHLATLLWGDRPDASARHSLSQALTTLRRSTGPVVEPLANDPEMLVLDADEVDVDVARFRELADQGSQEALDRAARLYAEPLAGLHVAQPEFEDWIDALRAELRDLAARVHENLLPCVLANEDYERAIRLANELLGIEPASEIGHRALISGHAARGNVARALEQYRICHEHLDNELGIAPSPETEKLAQGLTGRGSATERARSPGVLVAPVAAGNAVDRAVLEGIVDDVVAEILRLRSIEAVRSDVCVGADRAGAAAQLGAERGLDYGLAISLESTRGNARVGATLVRTANADPVWTSTQDLALTEIFNPGIVAAPVRHHIEQDWLRRARAIPEEEWDAYTHFLQGLQTYFEQWNTPESWWQALPHLERAVALGVPITQARVRRDSIRCHDEFWPGHDDLSERGEAFVEASRRALQVDPAEPNVRRMLAMMHLHARQFEAAHRQFSRGLRENPNDANLNVAFARYLAHLGKPAEALAAARRAQQLNPVHPDYYWEQLGLCLYVLERHDDALAAFQRIECPSYYERLYMAASHAAREQADAAARSLELALVEKPDLRASILDRVMPYGDEGVGRRLRTRLRAAGLPR